MKKFFAFCFLPLFVSGVFASGFYEGGPGRLAGMGVMSGVAIKDISSATDLYALGFSSGLVLREKQNVIAVYPDLLLYSSRRVPETPPGYEVKSSMFVAGSHPVSSGNLGIVYWFGPDTVICVKPYVSVFGNIFNETGQPDEKSDGTLAAGYADFAQRLGKEFSLGISGGYYFAGSEEKVSQDPDINRMEITKFSYQASASYAPDNRSGWSYAISAGNKINETLKALRTFEMYFPMDEIGLFAGRFDYMSYRKYFGTINTQEIRYYNKYSGINADAGAAYEDKAGGSLSLKAGGVFSVTNKEKKIDRVIVNLTGDTTETTTEKTEYDNGAGFGAELKAKKETDALIFGLSGKVMQFGYSRKINSAYKTNYVFWDSAAGISLKATKDLLIPFELAYEGYMNDDLNTDTDNKYRYILNLASGKLGAELGISENFAIRAGVSYLVMSDNSWHWVGDNLVSASAPAGTKDNRYTTQFLVTAGAGYKTESIEANIALGYVSDALSPADEYYKEYNKGAVIVKTDVKLFY